MVSHLVLSARWVGVPLVAGVKMVPVNIAFVVDETLLNDEFLDSKKCYFAALGTIDS
jgi:hypothetical protein